MDVIFDSDTRTRDVALARREIKELGGPNRTGEVYCEGAELRGSVHHARSPRRVSHPEDSSMSFPLDRISPSGKLRLT